MPNKRKKRARPFAALDAAALLDRFPTPALLLDAGGRIVAANHPVARCLATTPDALIGTALGDWAIDTGELRQCLGERGSVPWHLRFRAADGGERWLALSLAKGAAAEGDLVSIADVTRTMAEDGAPVRYQDLIRGGREASARVKAVQLALRESERRFRTLFEATSDWFWELDANLRFSYISPNYEALTGRKVAEQLGQRPDATAGRAGEGEPWRRLMALMEARRPFREFVYRMADRDGRRLWIKVSGIPVFDGEGMFGGYQGAATDVTAYVEAEATAQRAMRRLHEAVNHIAQPLSIYDAEGRLVACNEAYRDLHSSAEGKALVREGVSFREITEWRLATGFWRRSPLESGARFEPLEDGLRLGAASCAYELSDGRSMLVDTQVMEDGSAVSLWTDVTSFKAAEAKRAELEAAFYHANKLDALGQLAGGIAHDLNNTLVPILTLAKLTARRVPEKSREHSSLAIILDAAERARDLVKQILAFSRKEAPTRRSVDVAELVRQSLKMLRASVPAMIVIEQRIAAVPPSCCDPGQIHQIMTNLVTNAAQAIGHRIGTITVALAEAVGTEGGGATLHLSVADTGCGMDEATRRHIFEPFFTTKSVGEGTGLGLSVVQGIVAAHGGTIAVESAPGQGTRFDIHLPLVVPEGPPALREAVAG